MDAPAARGATLTVAMWFRGNSSRTHSSRRDPSPLPLPPPRECMSRKEGAQSHASASWRTPSNTLPEGVGEGRSVCIAPCTFSVYV